MSSLGISIWLVIAGELTVSAIRVVIGNGGTIAIMVTETAGGKHKEEDRAMKLEGDFELIEETLSIVDGTLEVTIKGAPTELTEEQIDLLRSLSLQRILIAGARLCLKKIKEAAYDVNSMGGQDG